MNRLPIVSWLALAAAGTAAAAPGVLPVQGQIATLDGDALEGPTTISFRIYPDEDAAEPFFAEDVTVEMIDGRFAARLGAGDTILELDGFASNPNAHLTVQVAGDTESDRVPLDSVPYAAYAAQAGTFGGLTYDELSDTIPTLVEIDETARNACIDSVDEILIELEDVSYVPAEEDLTALLDDLYLPVSYQPSWDDLTDLPAGFADDVDNDTTYTAGAGLALSSGAFSLDSTVHRNWIPNARFETGSLDGWTVVAGGATVVPVAAEAGGGYAVTNDANVSAWVSSNERIPVDRFTDYAVSGRFRRTDTTGTGACFYLAVRAFDASGVNIPGPTGGAWWWYPVECQTIGNGVTTWEAFHVPFGPGYKTPLPAAAATISVGVILNYDNGNRKYEATNIQLRTTDAPARTRMTRVTYTNGWTNFGGSTVGAGYSLGSDGRIYLEGVAKAPAGGGTTTMFVLPVGLRPRWHHYFTVMTDDGPQRVDVREGGDVVATALGTGTDWVSLDGISFLPSQAQ